MKPLRFLRRADADMAEAAAYYELGQPDLGNRFLLSVEEAANRIRLNPSLYPVVERDVRRCLTKTFPFAVLFRERPNILVVIAVMHLQRNPNYWKSR